MSLVEELRWEVAIHLIPDPFAVYVSVYCFFPLSDQWPFNGIKMIIKHNFLLLFSTGTIFLLTTNKTIQLTQRVAIQWANDTFMCEIHNFRPVMNKVACVEFEYLSPVNPFVNFDSIYFILTLLHRIVAIALRIHLSYRVRMKITSFQKFVVLIQDNTVSNLILVLGSS